MDETTKQTARTKFGIKVGFLSYPNDKLWSVVNEYNTDLGVGT